MFCSSCAYQLSDQTVICPRCGAPTALYNQKPPVNPVGLGTVIAAYVLSVIMPLLGLIAGIYLWAAKKQTFHGAACIIISFIFASLWGFLLLDL